MTDLFSKDTFSNEKHVTHIHFSGLSKSYGKRGLIIKRNQKNILDNIEIELRGGECALLSGENGSGKSTLLRIMAGLLKPDSAFINTGLESLSWKKARKSLLNKVMYLYQEPYMFDGTVYRNLSYAIEGKSSGNTDSNIKKALEWANLERMEHSTAKSLSGGERQRVAMAQAWLKRPSVLLLDEPTANMDENSRRRTEELLCKFKETGTALLIASHDPNHFHNIMDTRYWLNNGCLSEVDISSNTDISSEESPISTDNITPFPKGKKSL